MEKCGVSLSSFALFGPSDYHLMASLPLKWYAKLQSQRYCRGETIHEPRDGRPFLGHSDENFARDTIFIQADG